MMKALVLIAALALPTAAQADARRFDLACDGQSTYGSAGEEGEQPFHTTIHLDVPNMRYCTDTCAEISTIAHVDSLEILLGDATQNQEFSSYGDLVKIDRLSGTMTVVFLEADQRIRVHATARCTMKPFTPFPVTGL